jgi:dTDP-4-amino-4,6-dideoxygalactose transaminase
MIPVANPLAAYQHYQPALDAAFQRVMQSGRYILGPEVEAFEAEFAAYLGVRFAVGVASGTEALWLALRALELQPGDEVVVPSLTASATVAAIVESDAVPVFAEIRDSDLTLNAAQLESLLSEGPQGRSRRMTDRTRAIMPVHLYGNPADMTAITQFAKQHDLRVIEDCAQAHGARHAGQPVGTFGEVAAWSFYPTKNLGAFGDGGMVTTNDPEIAARLRRLREYGWRERYHSSEHGWNSRLDEVQAALLRVRLRHLEADNARRREIAARYRAALPATLRSPACAGSDLGVEHLFVMRSSHLRRDELSQKLKRAGVGTAVHYPIPCHLQQAYVRFGGGPNSLPLTEHAANEVLSLPMYPELSDEEVKRVIAAVLQALREM